MRIAVNPTRMELLQLRRRLAIAVKGHKLLKDKQDEMIRRFLLLTEEVRDLRRETEQLLGKVYSRTLMARAQISEAELRGNLLVSTAPLQIACERDIIMNVPVPACNIAEAGDPFSYSPLSMPGELDEAVALLRKTMPLLIKLAQMEKTVRILAAEIERTRRRVNALEYVLIPNLQETVRYIGMKLGELEREGIVRLMKIKEIVRQ
ncbi:MAG: V-type ATP synthase subunit D [bacterium]|jgi:V/A-type H+-transporting ATPase subunit D|nr:V-type ATP synthase subunit D [bacterium]MDD3805142.1 V-type ATP synthase subunit D [bacterium]MDD4152252.1 V-type ATP synthase subunit D [bacterium]MDD4559027.1 V-type ATP synthase subunit D [bacterium]